MSTDKDDLKDLKDVNATIGESIRQMREETMGQTAHLAFTVILPVLLQSKDLRTLIEGEAEAMLRRDRDEKDPDPTKNEKTMALGYMGGMKALILAEGVQSAWARYQEAEAKVLEKAIKDAETKEEPSRIIRPNFRV